MIALATATIIIGTIATYMCITDEPEQEITYNRNYKGHL